MANNNKAVEELSEKEVVLASLIESGMSMEEATETVNEMFQETSGVQLPYTLIKVNNEMGVADIGDIVGDAIKEEDEIISYNIIKKFLDVDFIILAQHQMYNSYDEESRQVTVKTPLYPPYTSKAKSIDSISGIPVSTLVAQGVECKFQVLATIAIRDKGTEEFEIFNMYLKGMALLGINKLLTANKAIKSNYKNLQLVTKVAKKGAVKFTEVVLDQSEVLPFGVADGLVKNIKLFADATKAHNEYVKAYNNSLKDEVPAETNDELPE